MKTTSIMIVGVGGQGTLLASRIIGNVALAQGFDVKMSEVHGMAQRGGSVVTYVKYGEEVFAPVISPGEADVILAFEELEAARWIPYLKEEGLIIGNRQRIEPMTVITGLMDYPEDLCEKIKKTVKRSIFVDALGMAKKAGNAKAVNLVLIGLMAKNSSIEKEIWLDAIRKTVPEKFIEVNLKAFDLGYEHI